LLCSELQKALAYVKFMNRNEVVASCVNSSLSLWDLSTMDCVRTYTGHVNVRNFVGMEVNGDYITCGSETSQVRSLVMLAHMML
jgi:E3 ubiquitin-protein ligase RFWD2